jgi:hypothetical protein
MPPERRDSEGNRFKVGWVYEYSFHKLELISIHPDKCSGTFRLIESYGSLYAGWTGTLTFDRGFKPLYLSEALKSNKGAAMLLSKEY